MENPLPLKLSLPPQLSRKKFFQLLYMHVITSPNTHQSVWCRLQLPSLLHMTSG